MLRQWYVLLAAVLMFSGFAHARDVSISLDGKQMELILNNPSTVAVNYNISCHKADGSGTIINLTNQTLAPNAQVKHAAGVPDTGLCAGGTPPNGQGTDANSKPYYFCDGANTYANAGNACGAGNTFCFPDISWGATPSGCSAASYWLKNDGAVQFQPSCSSYAAVTGGSQTVVGNWAAGYSGYTKKNPAATGCSYFYPAGEIVTSSTAGAVCCSNPSSGSVCKVTINTTATNAFLSSPSFMGGAAF